MKSNKNVFNIKEIIIIIIVTGVVCSLATGIILFSNYKYTGLKDDEYLNEFVDAYAKVIDQYYTEVDREGMIDNAISGMMNYLEDNYSIYMDQSEADSLTSQLSGEYKGIGIEILTNNVINSVFEDSPADEAGIKAGDIVVAVNGVKVANSSETISLMAESDENSLELTRNGESYTVKVKSEIIEKNIIVGELMEENNKKIGYINISSFTKNVDKQFEKVLNNLEEQEMESLIIDLRYNSGGYLDKTQNIASLFLEKNKLIYSLESKDGLEKVYDKTGEHRSYPIVVIINGASASASEVLAGALKDSYGAILVGQKSYGKGKVQQTMDLEDGGLIKYTTAKWLRPNGICIDEIGLEPDYEVILDGNPLEWESDTQLEKAVELLAK